MFEILIISCVAILIFVVVIKGFECLGCALRAVAMPPVCALIGAFVGVCCNVLFNNPWDADTLIHMFGFIGACVGVYAMYCEFRDLWYY